MTTMAHLIISFSHIMGYVRAFTLMLVKMCHAEAIALGGVKRNRRIKWEFSAALPKQHCFRPPMLTSTLLFCMMMATLT
jgi:hypothetical protein